MTNATELAKYLRFWPTVMAQAVMAKGPGKPVGAVVLGPDYEIRSTGHNGFARGVDENVPARWLKPERWFWMCHGEENAIANAARAGIGLKGCTILVSTLFPCTTCARLIIQSGIIKVISKQLPLDEQNPKWVNEAVRSTAMFQEAGVEVIHIPAIDCQPN